MSKAHESRHSYRQGVCHRHGRCSPMRPVPDFRNGAEHPQELTASEFLRFRMGKTTRLEALSEIQKVQSYLAKRLPHVANQRQLWEMQIANKWLQLADR